MVLDLELFRGRSVIPGRGLISGIGGGWIRLFWTNCWRNEEVLQRVNEEENIVQTYIKKEGVGPAT